MKKLSLPEFRDYCNTHRFSSIIFSTANQRWHSVDLPVITGLEFHQMIIMFNPNIIHLKDAGNSMQFNKVKEVKLGESNVLGVVFTLVCEDLNGTYNDVEYTLIGR